MKTAVSIPDPIFEAADDLARRMKISRSELYTRALSVLVSIERRRSVTAQLNRIYGKKRRSKPDPFVARAAYLTAARTKW